MRLARNFRDGSITRSEYHTHLPKGKHDYNAADTLTYITASDLAASGSVSSIQVIVNNKFKS